MPMSRYLTAQKVSLLILVNLYCSSGIPSSATIPILSFILSHSLPPVQSNARARRGLSDQNDLSISGSIEAFEEALQEHDSAMPGRTLLDVFLNHMWKLNSLDALHTLFDELGNLFVRPEEVGLEMSAPDRIYLSKTSPLGAFVRRAKLEFTRLQFDDTLKLWNAFIKYRAPTAKWSKRVAGFASNGIDIVAADMEIKEGHRLFDAAYGHLAEEEEDREMWSVDDLDRTLDFQLDQLQRLGVRVPDNLRDQLCTWVTHSTVALRQSHLVKFFDSWKAGDYTSAFDNLHRYYDYAMQTREKVHYQYALLHMAILHADFSCFSEAIATINETVATARENQDMACLNFSLNWLNHMSKAYPKQMKGAGYVGILGSERDGLNFLKARAKEAKMYNLLSATLLNEAKLCLSTGESVPRALELMYQASHLNVRENINSHGSIMLMNSVLYSRLGNLHLSTVYGDLLQTCYKRGSPIDEQIRAICRSALGSLKSGRYEQALQDLEKIETPTHRSLKLHQFIFLCAGLIKLKRAIRWTDWATCDALLLSLKPDSSTDPELSFHLSEARIDYLISRGLYDQAMSAIGDLRKSLKEEGADILPRIDMLLLTATLFTKVGTPERGFSAALRAASVAFKARLMPSLWSAVDLICATLNSIGEFQAAAWLLNAIIPQALEYTDHMLSARLYSQISNSFIGMAGLEDPSTSNGARMRTAKVNRAETYIARAQESYKKAEDLDGELQQLMKRALIAKLRGDEKLAEEWAQNHNSVYDQAMERIETR